MVLITYPILSVTSPFSIGIRMARQPADRDHRFGHWKIEDLASLVTSIIMFYVGFDVLRDTVQKIPQ